MVCDVVHVSECIPPAGRAHTQHQRFSERRVRVAHAMTNNWKIPLECLWSTWEELKDALKSVVWKGWKRVVNRKVGL